MGVCSFQPLFAFSGGVVHFGVFDFLGIYLVFFPCNLDVLGLNLFGLDCISSAVLWPYTQQCAAFVHTEAPSSSTRC